MQYRITWTEWCFCNVQCLKQKHFILRKSHNIRFRFAHANTSQYFVIYLSFLWNASLFISSCWNKTVRFKLWSRFFSHCKRICRYSWIVNTAVSEKQMSDYDLSDSVILLLKIYGFDDMSENIAWGVVNSFTS